MRDEFVEGTWRVSRLNEDASVQERLHLARHMAAYQFALSKFKTKELVLDVACGYGLGVEKVAEVATSTIALDLARQALDSVPAIPGLAKVQADATKLPFASDSVDAILAFQLIEHVPRSGALAMLREFQRVIRPNGMAFVTTPNARWRLLPLQKPWNPYHVKEYRPKEILKLCEDAGLHDYAVTGLIGRGGAHEVEQMRVRQDPAEVYLRLNGRYRWYVRKFIEMVFGASKKEHPIVAGDGADSYEFCSNFRDGLDFMVVIQKNEEHR